MDLLSDVLSPVTITFFYITRPGANTDLVLPVYQIVMTGIKHCYDLVLSAISFKLPLFTFNLLARYTICNNIRILLHFLTVFMLFMCLFC